MLQTLADQVMKAMQLEQHPMQKVGQAHPVQIPPADLRIGLQAGLAVILLQPKQHKHPMQSQ